MKLRSAVLGVRSRISRRKCFCSGERRGCSGLVCSALVKVRVGWLHTDSVTDLRVPEHSGLQLEEMSFLTHRQEAEHCHYPII